MIKITKRLFFYAAFLLCAALVFAADNSKKTDKPAIRVYDSKDKLVCELTESEDIESFNYLLTESAVVAADDAAFTQVPENAKIAYRYDIPNNSSADIRLLIYADSHIAYIPNAPKGDDVPEVFAWELFGEAYKILSKPASLKKALARYQDSDKNIFVYDAEGFLVSEARVPSILHVFGKVMDVYAGDANDHQFSGSILPERSVHEGKQLLYRYTIWAFKDEPIRIYVYSDTDKVVLTNTFPAWVDCTLTKEGYELFSNPKRLIDRLNRVAIELMDIR